MKIILTCLTLLMVYWMYEYLMLSIKRRKIPNRILVTGTRGKSSVTRLVAAGLNAAGIKTIAKVTGSAARIIMPDGTEHTIQRNGMPTILEQKKIISIAVENKAQCLVVEGMAIRPQMIKTESFSIIKPNSIIVCRIGPDHLDITAETIPGLVKAYSKTITENSMVFTLPENRELFAKRCFYMDAELYDPVDMESNALEIPLDRFSYIEHKENIELALQVCNYLGVDSGTALSGMLRANPDPGALALYKCDIDNSTITFIQAFAANDTHALSIIQESLKSHLEGNVIIIINTRKDRPFRSREMLKYVQTHSHVKECILTGNGHLEPLRQELEKSIKTIILEDTESIIAFISKNTLQPATILGIGNLYGAGQELCSYFKNKCTTSSNNVVH